MKYMSSKFNYFAPKKTTQHSVKSTQYTFKHCTKTFECFKEGRKMWFCVRGSQTCLIKCILVPRGRAPFGQHQKSRPLARSNDIPVLNGFVNTIDWDQNQSHLSDLTLSMRRVTGSPWIADFRCWTWPEVVIFGADQKERGLWGREWIKWCVELRFQRTLVICIFLWNKKIFCQKNYPVVFVIP